MILSHLDIVNFKNIGMASCTFAPKLNGFFGGNGMGKTNLLDAIHYLSVVRSHMGTVDADAVRFDAEEAIVQGRYYSHRSSQGGALEEEALVLKVHKEKNKVLSRNGKLYPRLSNHIGKFPLVIVSPQDYKLIRGGSDERRRFFDRLLSQNNAYYLNSLINYTKALTQRNNLLRQQCRDDALYDFVESILAERGVEIARFRREFTALFTPLFGEMYTFLAQDAENVSLIYRHDLPDSTSEWNRMLSHSRAHDREIGHTTRGVHKDDWEMLIGDRLMRKIGSEGQNKTFLVALKMAEYQHQLTECAPLRPILLLDDLFDKLDAGRVERIIELVSGEQFGQIFITDTNRKYLDEIIRAQSADYTLFHVDRGTVLPMD